jgi:NAD(P)-dependent dehydrogenase (short-subunit alcohol dehydrogenase family)
MAHRNAKDLFDLRGKVAVITGGGGGLCGSMSEALGELGVKVAVVDLALDKAEAVADVIRKDHGEAKSFAANVLDVKSMETALAAIRSSLGDPDLLVNGAGGNDPRGTTTVEFLEKGAVTGLDERGFFDLEPEGFQRTFELNFQGTVLATRVFTRGMVEKGAGAVLNISSMSALAPLTKVGAYSAAKAAVANFTRWLAVHFARTGVRVNALAPGFFMTDQLRFLHVDESTGEFTPRAKSVISHTPMGRYGEPEDLWGAMVWLLSDASRFVTGIVVPVDGGFSSFSI